MICKFSLPVINHLCDKWTDPESEIFKRMNSFSEKKPGYFKADFGKLAE